MSFSQKVGLHFSSGNIKFKSNLICYEYHANSIKINAGTRVAKKLLREYGDRLICVRYRYDKERKKPYKTVELITE